jgi:hypothetical protein
MKRLLLFAVLLLPLLSASPERAAVIAEKSDALLTDHLGI